MKPGSTQAIMNTSNTGSSHRSMQPATYSNLQRPEKDKLFSRHNMPGPSSSRETQRHNPKVAENAAQIQGAPKSSGDQIVPRGSTDHPTEAQINKMTFEQVVSSILQFLGKDPHYMASVDPNHPKSQKRKRNPKISKITSQASKK